ncbi:alpha/beta hydrolase [Georgenia sp. Z1344]|uniref:alpha/beta hydrolase n=1 Tax=Georgenia sp. Z1344 TaxID=3416706 RepID=UPI003CE975E2
MTTAPPRERRAHQRTGLRTVRAAGLGVLAFTGTAALLLLASSLAAPGWSRAPVLDPPDTVPVADLGLTTPPTGGFTVTSDVVAPTGADAWLALPDDGADVALVLQPGAGAADRDRMREVAEHLAALGIAALTYDKRDTGPSPLTRDYPALTADLAAAVDHLRERTGAGHVGILSVSEGGWLAPAAARLTDVDLLILAVAPTVTPLEQVSWIADARIDGAPDWVRRIPATALASGRDRFDYTDTVPVPDLAALDVPVLGLWGAEDGIVPVTEAVRRSRAALDGHLVAVSLPGVGHELPPEALDLAAAWLAAGAPTPDDGGADAPEALLHGAAPSRLLGVAELPDARWFMHPLLHLAVSALVTTLVVRRALGHHALPLPLRRARS